MTADRWAQAVREQLGLGRLLPLGGSGDGAWIAESAADGVLRQAAQRLGGVRLGTLRIGPLDPEGGESPAVPAPPSALPVGALRITADFSAVASEPLPTAADRLRSTLATAAADGLGLDVAEVDLRVTGLLDAEEPADAYEGEDPTGVREAEKEGEAPDLEGDEDRAGRAALAVPGVTRLTGMLGGLGRAVHVEERATPGALAARHVRVEVAVDRAHRALDVALAIRHQVADALPDRPSVAVIVTATEAP
ncbi:nucleopolyhedrovirus P10 family protein [Streptomyces sp. NPDC059009]|uniref:nucleopolyhedrovirus P10 family protein n=1 Tax=Streptomyces sp. NPDC059009 TaxID=3346694 RepID=UPI00369D1923